MNPILRDLVTARLKGIECAPCVFARLVRLSSYRDPETNRYSDRTLTAVPGGEEADRFLRGLHEQVFREWLLYPLSRQHRDLELYLSFVPRPKVEILRVWRQTKIHHTYAPEHLECFELKLFAAGLDALVGCCGTKLPRPARVSRPTGPPSIGASGARCDGWRSSGVRQRSPYARPRGG